ETRAGVRLYRGTAAYHHIVGLHRGPRPGLVRIVFDVADRDGVDALHHAVSTAGGSPRQRGSPPTAAATASVAAIRTGATSPSCARAPTTRTSRTCLTGRA